MTQDDRDDELLDMDLLLAWGLDPTDARAVLGPHTALPRWQIAERLELLRLERERASEMPVDVWDEPG